MEAAVVVPWRPDGGHRDAAWHLLKQRHLDAGRTVIEGVCDGPWVKATAVADALTRTTAELLIVHDADVWCDGLNQAVTAIDHTTRWAIPHDKVWRLAEGQFEPTKERAGLAQAPYVGWAGGGIVVLDRAAYEACPLDPRFVGWGQEDASWALALTCLYGLPWRGPSDLWHWWHAPQDRLDRTHGSRESKALHRRYRRASATRHEMQSLIGEIAWPTSTSTPTSTNS